MTPEPQIRSKRLPVGGRTDGRLTAAGKSADRRLEAPHTNGHPAASLPLCFLNPFIIVWRMRLASEKWPGVLSGGGRVICRRGGNDLVSGKEKKKVLPKLFRLPVHFNLQFTSYCPRGARPPPHPYFLFGINLMGVQPGLS